MADEGAKVDNRFEYLKDRIATAFPKLAGPKFDKAITSDDTKLVKILHICPY